MQRLILNAADVKKAASEAQMLIATDNTTGRLRQLFVSGDAIYTVYVDGNQVASGDLRQAVKVFNAH